MIDFANSYMTWFGADGGSISRIDIEAACTLVDDAGRPDDYYLIAPCRAEHTHSDGQLIVMPTYDFRGIFGRTHHRLLRKHWVSDPDYLDDAGLDTTGGRVLDEVGWHSDRWKDVRLDIGRFETFTELTDAQDVVDATLENRTLVAITELADEASGVRAVLEYPVKTMNVLPSQTRYQVRHRADHRAGLRLDGGAGHRPVRRRPHRLQPVRPRRAHPAKTHISRRGRLPHHRHRLLPQDRVHGREQAAGRLGLCPAAKRP